MDLKDTIMISAAGMRAQGVRMRVIAENLANVASLPLGPDQDPYRRKMVTFKNELDRELDIRRVNVGRVIEEQGDFSKEFDPAHPGADADGYVKLPNVNAMIELMDMREAQRSYEANINVVEAAKRMIKRTIDMLQ